MAKTIALCGQKGGTGKSTIALHLAAEWMRRGRSVLLVDADPQGTARTWADVAAGNGHQPPTTVAMGEQMHRPGQLPKMRDAFDIAVVDCPPAHGRIQRSAMMCADIVLLPCGPSPNDVWALAETLDVLSEAQTVRPELSGFVVLNRLDRRTGLSAQVKDALGAVEILPVSVHQRVAYAEAIAAGRGITDYRPSCRAAVELRVLCDTIEDLVSLSSGEPS